MAKIALFADLHVRAEKLKDFAFAWEEYIKQLAQQKINFIAIAGDVFDKFNIAGRSASVGDIVRAFTQPLIDYDMYCLIINGNHDKANSNELLPATAVLKMNNRFYVVDNLEAISHGGVRFVCIPWINNATPEDKAAIVAFVEKEKPQIVLGHLEVDGIELTNNYKLFGTKFNFSKDQVDRMQAACEVLALGHVHNFNKNYLGAFQQLNHGDEGNQVGYHIYDPDTNEVVYVENHISPRYITVDVNNPDEFMKKHYENDYVKFRFHFKPTSELLGKIDGLRYTYEEVSENEVVRRIGSDIKNMSVYDLLSFYLKEKGFVPDDITFYVDKLKEVLK